MLSTVFSSFLFQGDQYLHQFKMVKPQSFDFSFLIFCAFYKPDLVPVINL